MERIGNNGLMKNPQVLAWTVVLISFVLFCILCVASTFAAYWFFFESPMQLTTRLVVSRGAITVNRPDGTSYVVNNNNPNNYVLSNSGLQIDANSQAYLTFEDSYTGQIVGTLFLLGNSSLTFNEAFRPRFEWSRGRYAMLLADAMGRFAVDIPSGINRGLVLNIRSGPGTAYFEEPGSYSVDASDQQIQLYTRYGKAFLYNAPSQAWQVNSNAVGVLEKGKQDASLRPYPYDMLNLPYPGPVQPSFGTEDNPDNKTLPLFWACDRDPQSSNEIPGTAVRSQIDNQVVLRITRRGTDPQGRPLGPAAAGCSFYFPLSGLRIDQYASFSIQIKMKLMFQDVTTCGIAGSECPVMLMLEYKDKNGQKHFWRQGFYSLRPPSDTYIQLCDTCPHDHQQINKDTWYIFDTGDLKQQFPPDLMDTITYVRVYASGHQFEVAIAELTVLGGKQTGQ